MSSRRKLRSHLFQESNLCNDDFAPAKIPGYRRRSQAPTTEKLYLIRFKPSEISAQTMVAAKAEIHGEHLVLLNAKGKINALFLMDAVESWSQIPSRRAPITDGQSL